MTQSFNTPGTPVSFPPVSLQSGKPAICWAGILGGVFVTLSLTAVLTILGAGLGFALKPVGSDLPSAKTIGVLSIIWLILVQWLSSATGGYITGRLRTRWVNVHMHEVFFRDTAHGFVTWAVANIALMSLLMWFGAAAGHQAMHMAAPVYGLADGTQEQSSGRHGRISDPMAYYSDSLLRSPTPTASPPDQDVKGEVNRILLKGLKDDSISEEDKTYLAQLVSTRTGLSEPDARRRVDDVLARENADEAQLRELADNARKSASILSLCIALSMLVGAFVASIAAALGGNIRDRYT